MNTLRLTASAAASFLTVSMTSCSEAPAPEPVNNDDPIVVTTIVNNFSPDGELILCDPAGPAYSAFVVADLSYDPAYWDITGENSLAVLQQNSDVMAVRAWESASHSEWTNMGEVADFFAANLDALAVVQSNMNELAVTFKSAFAAVPLDYDTSQRECTGDSRSPRRLAPEYAR